MQYMIQTDDRKYFVSREFEKFTDKNNTEVVKCAPYQHQGNGQAKQGVDTLKNMIRKYKKAKAEQMCYDLNNMQKVGFRALSIEMFSTDQQKVKAMFQ